MEKGYIKLSRSFFDNEIWQAARAFSECEAWLDLIQSARFEASPTTSRIGSYEVTWGRGQYPASVRFLAKKWGRSEQWVRTFIGKLKRKGMVSVDNSQGTSVITLLNFEKYNGTEETIQNTPGNTPFNTPNIVNISDLKEYVTHLVAQQLTHLAENQHTPNTNNKKEEEYKETTPKGVAKKPSKFIPPSVEEVRAYVSEKGYHVDPETFVNFYESKGWYVGKNKMKNWRAAVATWQKNEKEHNGNNRNPYWGKQEANDYALQALQERMEQRRSGLQDELPKPF